MYPLKRTPRDKVQNLPPFRFYSPYARAIELDALHLFAYFVSFQTTTARKNYGLSSIRSIINFFRFLCPALFYPNLTLVLDESNVKNCTVSRSTNLDIFVKICSVKRLVSSEKLKSTHFFQNL